MNDEKEKKQTTNATLNISREWIAPEFTVLNIGATAGGPVLNTLEASNYHS